MLIKRNRQCLLQRDWKVMVILSAICCGLPATKIVVVCTGWHQGLFSAEGGVQATTRVLCGGGGGLHRLALSQQEGVVRGRWDWSVACWDSFKVL